MAKKLISECFWAYGAKQENVQWSVSAWTDDGSLVVSLWSHHKSEPEPGVWVFEDRFDRWSGPGNSEFRRNVGEAFERDAVLRLVLAKTSEVSRVQRGDDVNTIAKTFSVRPEWVGRVTHAYERSYRIEFRYQAE